MPSLHYLYRTVLIHAPGPLPTELQESIADYAIPARDWDVLVRLTQQEHLPPSVIEKLEPLDNNRVQMALARHPEYPPARVEARAQTDRRGVVTSALATVRGCSAETYRALARSRARATHVALALNQDAPLELRGASAYYAASSFSASAPDVANQCQTLLTLYPYLTSAFVTGALAPDRNRSAKVESLAFLFERLTDFDYGELDLVAERLCANAIAQVLREEGPLAFTDAPGGIAQTHQRFLKSVLELVRTNTVHPECREVLREALGAPRVLQGSGILFLLHQNHAELLTALRTTATTPPPFSAAAVRAARTPSDLETLYARIPSANALPTNLVLAGLTSPHLTTNLALRLAARPPDLNNASMHPLALSLERLLDTYPTRLPLALAVLSSAPELLTRERLVATGNYRDVVRALAGLVTKDGHEHLASYHDEETVGAMQVGHLEAPLWEKGNFYAVLTAFLLENLGNTGALWTIVSDAAPPEYTSVEDMVTIAHTLTRSKTPKP